MSNYTKATNFATKDALTSGNPLKTLSGTELDDEFNAIQAASITKANTASAQLTGIPVAPTAAADTSTTQLATTAFVTTEANLKADLASPTFTGVPAAPTAAADTSTTQLATTAFVTTEANLKADLAGAAFTGAITTTSTIDGVDIATRDGVLTTTTTTANAALPKAGGILTGDVSHGDNVKAKFGTSDDLQIYHDGANSWIQDAGVGILGLKTDGVGISMLSSTGDTMFQANRDADVSLYYDNFKKLATTSTGVDVTGTVVADGFGVLTQTNAIENKSKLLQTEDIIADYVVTGLLPATSASLVSNISLGKAYVSGVRVSNAATANTYTASVDTYVDVNSLGVYTFPSVALAAAAPAVTADSIRLAKVVTNATAITAVTDLRALTLVLPTALDVTGTVTADGLNLGDNQWIYAGDGADLKIGSDGASTVIRSQGSPLYIDANGTTFRGYSPYTKHMDIATNGDISFYEDTGTTPKFFWDASAESLGIGGASTFTSGTNIEVADANVARLGFTNTSTNGSQWAWFAGTSGQAGLYDYDNSRQAITVDNSGNVGIGTSSPDAKLSVYNATTADTTMLIQNGTDAYASTLSLVANNDGGATYNAITSSTLSGSQHFKIWGGGSSNTLAMSTAGVEAMRISATGNVLTNCTTIPSSTVQGFMVTGTSSGNSSSSGASSSAYNHFLFYNSNGIVGSISTSGSATAYTTSSDYRLKELDVPMTGATERVKALRPINFAWKADGSRVDGFFAHELAEVVPAAATGIKDAMMDEEYEVTPAVVDAEGVETTAAVMGTRSVPDMQGIDQSKLVPLLTSALQEAIAKIETLETRIAALEPATTPQ